MTYKILAKIEGKSDRDTLMAHSPFLLITRRKATLFMFQKYNPVITKNIHSLLKVGQPVTVQDHRH